MQPIEVLLLGFSAADDLALLFGSAVEANPSFNFKLKEKSLGSNCLSDPSRFLAETFSGRRPDLVVLHSLESRSEEAENLLGVIRQQFQEMPIVIAAGTSKPTDLCRWLDLGATDFIALPFRSIEALPRLWRLCPQTMTTDAVVAQLKEKLGLKQLVGESPALLHEINKIPLVARCDATVLIAGETGTGKEMVARAIHHLSPRSAKSFVPVNCGAIPQELVENELFGHEPGAFTGAQGSRVGLLQKADGGSLFLDEVDCLPLQSQVKLLRFLQEKEFRPLGAQEARHVDVRVVAASNADLEQAVKQGRFRQDLYYRLNVIGLVLPPLRERKEDIPILARHFVAKYAAAVGAPARELTKAAVQKLMLHDWPGNVRELENVIERSVVLSRQTILHTEHLELPKPAAIDPGESLQTLKAKTIARFERGYIQELLRTHNGNITRAARAAGKNRRAFWEMMRKHQISVRPDPRSSVSDLVSTHEA